MMTCPLKRSVPLQNDICQTWLAAILDLCQRDPTIQNLALLSFFKSASSINPEYKIVCFISEVQNVFNIYLQFGTVGGHLGLIIHTYIFLLVKVLHADMFPTMNLWPKYKLTNDNMSSYDIRSFQLLHISILDGGHLGFEFWDRTSQNSAWHPIFLKSAYSKTPIYQISCFLPEVHNYFTYPPH